MSNGYIFRVVNCTLLFIVMILNNLCKEKSLKLTIDVIAPQTTPTDAEIFIAGNHESAGDWNPGLVKMDKVNELIWSKTLLLPSDYSFEFKITRGSWTNEAIYKEGEIPPNQKINLMHDTTITLRPINWKDFVFSKSETIIGSVKYHRNVYGDGLNYPRDLIVWLPPSYETDITKRYPVLYMHDGQNIIDPATSFIGYDWHVDEVSDSLIKAGKMREIIIVGIYNSPDRADEYDDTKLGRAYRKFIIERVKPLIDSTYRTLPDRDNTAVMGSSMGGLISFLIVWHHSDIFSQAGCISPVFRPNFIKEVENYSGPEKNIRIYIDNGGVGLDKQLQNGCDSMLIALRKIGFMDGRDLEWFCDPRAEHNEYAWAKRVWRPLMFMFSKNIK